MKNILLLFILFTGLVSWGQDYDVYLDNFYSDNQNKSVNHYTYKIPNHVNSVEITLDPGVIPDGIYIKHGDQEYWSGFMGSVYNLKYKQVALSIEDRKLMLPIQSKGVKDYIKNSLSKGDNDYSEIVNVIRNFVGELVIYKRNRDLIGGINSAISGAGGKMKVNSLFDGGDGNAEKITDDIINGGSLRENIIKYEGIMEQNVSFIIDKESHHSSVEIIVFSPLERKMSDVLIKTCNSCQEPLNNVSVLEEKSNQYYLNGSLYDGSVYDLYDSGQLQEEFQVKGGKIEGDKIIYHQDNSFRKDKYKDATLITRLESNLTSLKDELSSMEKDSSGYYNIQKSRRSEMGDKFYKYKEKYKEGKLKGKKLELYKDYLIYTKKLKEKTSELGVKRNEKKNGEQELKSEKNKSKYVNKIKDVYQYSDGICSFHKEYNKYENLVLEEEMKEGIRNGSYKRYENGKIKEEGTYLNNKKDGLWTFHSYNGKEEITFSNDVKDGPFKKIKGDIIVEQGTYSNDLMTGEWIFRWDNGNLKGQGNYIDGDGGNLGSTGIPKNGRDGFWILYHENGNKGQSLNYKNLLPEGEYLLFYTNGQLEKRSYFVNGLLVGESISYHENGNKLGVRSFVNGKEEGRTFVYYESGNIRTSLNYSNGKREGEYLDYYENGSIKRKINFSNNKMNGEDKRYYESGEIQFRLFHKEGKRDRTKKTTCYYKNGNIWYEGYAGDGETEWYGEFKKYHENGNLMEISNYDMSGNGRILSTKKYDSNGEEIIEKTNDYSSSYQSDYYRKEVCSGIVTSKTWYRDGRKVDLRVRTTCPYCSDKKYQSIKIDSRRCEDQEIECRCRKIFIVKQCLIKHLDKGNNF